MKKTVLVLLLAVFIAMGAFAQEGAMEGMSFGVGVYFDGSYGNGLKIDGKNILGNSEKLETTNDNISIGGFIFFDVKYAEISIGLAYGEIRPKIDGSDKFGDYKIGYSEGMFGALLDVFALALFGVAEMDIWQLNFSILGKYPLKLGPLALYPLVGMDYNRIIAGTMRLGGEKVEFEGKKPTGDGSTLGEEEVEKGEWYEKEVSAYSQFGILAGVGLDISFGKKMYLRVQGLYNLRLPNEFQTTVAKEVWNNKAKPNLGHGPRIKVGVGFNL